MSSALQGWLFQGVSPNFEAWLNRNGAVLTRVTCRGIDEVSRGVFANQKIKPLQSVMQIPR